MRSDAEKYIKWFKNRSHMKILGSGKLDDFGKVVLSEKTIRALNVKPGDSVLFYRGGGRIYPDIQGRRCPGI